jgi:hypothetical protein
MPAMRCAALAGTTALVRPRAAFALPATKNISRASGKIAAATALRVVRNEFVMVIAIA